jgi:hypothetical protein
MCPTGAYTYIFLQHSPRGMLHIYKYVLVSAYGTYMHDVLVEARLSPIALIS